MKIKLAALILISVLVAPLISMKSSMAVDIFPGCNSGGNAVNTSVCQDVNSKGSSGNPIIYTIKVVINIISLVIGVASIIIIIISGLRMVLAGGEPKAVAQARGGVVYALIGVAVTLVAQAIVLFVLNRF